MAAIVWRVGRSRKSQKTTLWWMDQLTDGKKWTKKNIYIYKVDYCLFVIWFNDISDLTSKFLWSQIFVCFCSVDFTRFNNTWYNSQTWFKVTIFRSFKIFFPDLVTSTFLLIYLIFFYIWFSFKVWYHSKLLKNILI